MPTITKICSSCRHVLPINEFRKRTKKGRVLTLHTCKTCREADRLRAARHKAQKLLIPSPKAPSISDFPDEVIFHELKSRGYSGILSFQGSVTI